MAQRQVLAVLVRRSLGLFVVFGELHCGLTALGQQRPVREERLLLPRRHVAAVAQIVLLQRQNAVRDTAGLKFHHFHSKDSQLRSELAPSLHFSALLIILLCPSLIEDLKKKKMFIYLKDFVFHLIMIRNAVLIYHI